MTNTKTKPKCNKGTACGYACISGKKQCSDRIKALDAADLLKATQPGTSASPKASGRRTDGTHSDLPRADDVPPSDRVSYTWRTDENGQQKYFKVTQDGATGKKTEESVSRAELNKAIADEFSGDPKQAWKGKDLRSPEETAKLFEAAAAKRVTALTKLTGLSESDAKSAIDAVEKYSNADNGLLGYSTLRNVERGVLKDGEGNDLTKSQQLKAKKLIDSINSVITKLPAYNGSVHRGMAFDTADTRNAFVKSLGAGDFSFEAMTSFSSDRSQARTFLGLDNNLNLLITVKKNRSGASIKALSEVPEEDEVLVPGSTKYKLVGKPKKVGGMLAVELEEI